jgi:hypothetical protein
MPATESDHTPLRVDTLYVIDLDRCLLDTRKAQYLLESVADMPGPMRVARERTEAEGGSFNTLGYLREFTDPTRFNEITRQFLERAKDKNLFEPGAVALLDAIEKRGLTYMIMTYGGLEWQTMKLDAVGLGDQPYKIIDVKGKGRVLAECYDVDRGVYVMTHIENLSEGIEAQSVVLIDDKVRSFEDLPEKEKGIHVLPESPEHEVSNQTEGVLPGNVRTVRGLAEATEILFGRQS